MEPHVFYARTTDDVTIAYAVVGAGPTLVLLPGVPFSNFLEEWRIPILRGVYERLAVRLQIVQYDGRGTGHSQRDVSDLSLDAMLRDLDAVVGQAGIERFALLGFYNSCTHAIAYAALHPSRVTRLVLFGGSSRGWLAMSAPETQALLSLIERDWGVFVESAAHAWMGWSVGEAGRLAADSFRNATTPAVARATFQAASAIDVSDDLAAVTAPTLVLHRTDIEQIPRAVCGAAQRSSPPAFRRVAGLVLREYRRSCRRDHRLRYRRPSGRAAATVGRATKAERARAHSARARCPSPHRTRRDECRDRTSPHVVR